MLGKLELPTTDTDTSSAISQRPTRTVVDARITPSACAADDLPRDEARIVRREVRSELRDLSCLSKPSERDSAAEARNVFRVGEIFLAEVGAVLDVVLNDRVDVERKCCGEAT